MRLWPAGRGRWESQNETVARLVVEGGSLRTRLRPAGSERWESQNETRERWESQNETRERWEPQNETVAGKEGVRLRTRLWPSW